MQPRVATGLLVTALVRRIGAEGGTAMVLAKGDATAGTLLIQLADRGAEGALLERRPDAAGYVWAETGPADPAERPAYIERRRRADPDLWVVEADHPHARAIVLAVVE